MRRKKINFNQKMSPPAGQSGSKQKLGGIEFAMWANEQAVIASACKYINPNQSGETCSPNQGYFCHNVETNLLKRTLNRLNGFYMMIILVLNRLSRIYVESFAVDFDFAQNSPLCKSSS